MGPHGGGQRIRVLLVEDHEVVRAGLRLILEKQPDMEVVGERGRGDEVVEAVRALKPDVVVLDIALPGLDGTQVVGLLAREQLNTRVIALTAHPDESTLRVLLRAGVAGYVLKLSPASDLCHAIRAVMNGRVYVDSRMHRHLAPEGGAEVPGRFGSRAPDLSERECQVLKLIALGYTHREIARRIRVSVKTVDTYSSRISEKLGLTSRAEIVRLALAAGILREGEV